MVSSADLVEMAGDGRDGVVRIERADDRLRAADVVRLEELHLAHDLGVVVAAEGVGRLAADEAAGRVRIEAVGVFDQIADEIVPVRIVERPLVHERAGVEILDRPARPAWGGCRRR